MPDDDLFLKTIEAAYASGVEDDRLPEALTALSQLLGGAGAVLEIVDKRELRHKAFCSVGLPDLARVPLRPIRICHTRFVSLEARHAVVNGSG